MGPLLRRLVYVGLISGGRITPRARSVLSAVKSRVGDSRSRPRDILFRELLEREDCAALNILKRMGYSRQMLIAHVELNLHRPVEAASPRQTLASLAEFAFSEAKNLNHGYLGSEHLLLGILRDEAESHDVDRYGISLSKAREEVIREFSAL